MSQYEENQAYSREAEEVVLAACLSDPLAPALVVDWLNPNDFFVPRNGNVFKAIREIHAAGLVVDAPTVAAKLQERGVLKQSGGAAYLFELTECLASSVNIEHNARTVRRDSVRREFRLVASNAAIQCGEYGSDPEEIIAAVESRALVLRDCGMASDTGISAAILEAVRDLDEAKKSGGVVGIPTGFSYLDWLTGGMMGGQLIVVAGRPGMGKTAFCTSVTESAALHGAPTVLFGLEMQRREYASRMLCQRAEVPVGKIRGGLTAAEEKALSMAAAGLSDLPIHIVDRGVRTMPLLKAAIRSMVQKHGAKFAVVDYLQLIVGTSSRSRNDDVGEYTRELKSLAKELNIPIMLLSQLSRKCEERSDKRPGLSDLRDSGSIEQDADMVWFLYRDAYYQGGGADAQSSEAELIVAKQRNGPVGTARLWWTPTLTRYSDPAVSGFIAEG